MAGLDLLSDNVLSVLPAEGVPDHDEAELSRHRELGAPGEGLEGPVELRQEFHGARRAGVALKEEPVQARVHGDLRVPGATRHQGRTGLVTACLGDVARREPEELEAECAIRLRYLHEL